MKRMFGWLLAIALLSPAIALAEPTVYLKDGSIFHGNVIGTSGGVLTIQTKSGKITVAEGDILRIDYGAPTPTPAPAAMPNPWSAVPEATPPPARPASSDAARPAAHPASKVSAALDLKVGYHLYQGSGWSLFDKAEKGSRAKFNAPALEIALPIRVADDQIAIDVVPTLGYYAGSGCIADGAGSCFSSDFTNLYLDFGPRGVLKAGSLSFYGQAGAGVYHSTVSFSDRAQGLAEQSNDRNTIAVHALVGASAALTREFHLFGEAKAVNADGKFPNASRNFDMGGFLFLAGVGYRFGI